ASPAASFAARRCSFSCSPLACALAPLPPPVPDPLFSYMGALLSSSSIGAVTKASCVPWSIGQRAPQYAGQGEAAAADMQEPISDWQMLWHIAAFIASLLSHDPMHDPLLAAQSLSRRRLSLHAMHSEALGCTESAVIVVDVPEGAMDGALAQAVSKHSISAVRTRFIGSSYYPASCPRMQFR